MGFVKSIKIVAEDLSLKMEYWLKNDKETSSDKTKVKGKFYSLKIQRMFQNDEIEIVREREPSQSDIDVSSSCKQDEQKTFTINEEFTDTLKVDAQYSKKS